MPVPLPQPASYEVFPPQDAAWVDAARTSSWYPSFRHVTVPATIIDLDALGEREAFLEWMDADSIFLPEGSEGPSQSRQRSASISSASSSSCSSSAAPVYQLPKLNAAIREALAKHGGAVFPKLNWTSPKDAAFILPQSSHGPLHCTSPADVYLLLKSSDFINHDLDPERAYRDCKEGSSDRDALKVELVLKTFMQVDPAREVRCFVRDNILIGISQRDANFYDHLQSPETRTTICETVREFWEDELLNVYSGGRDYIFDLYLSSSLTAPILIDINPYRPSTDPLLFTYPELLAILTSTDPNRPRLPILKVVDSPAHPSASRAQPMYGRNMMPVEMVEMSEGRSMEGFREEWEDAVRRGMSGG